MENKPGSVVLIFRKIEQRWRDEHPLNLLAAFATRSQYSHVEIAIGDEAGEQGEIRNVLRIFNDDIGVEVAQRTGRSPAFHYVQLGCSLASEHTMLNFAHAQVGKPFSMKAMMRSVVWPRVSDGSNWFCAELVAATLQKGGLYPMNENPGAATPESLYRRFISQATTTGNPCTMRSILPNGNSASHTANRGQSATEERRQQVNPLLKHCNITLGGTLASRDARMQPRMCQVAAQYSHPSHPSSSNQVSYGSPVCAISRNAYLVSQTNASKHYVYPANHATSPTSRSYYNTQPTFNHYAPPCARSNAEEAIRQAVRRANIEELSHQAQQKVVTLDIR